MSSLNRTENEDGKSSSLGTPSISASDTMVPTSPQVRVLIDFPTINMKETMELLECPVCLDALTPPIFQCKEGHALVQRARDRVIVKTFVTVVECNECRNKISNKICPTCRAGPVDVRCRVLDRLADSVGEVNCRFVHMGCTDRIKYRSKKDHESRCLFKSFQCLHYDAGCPYEGSSEDLVKHLVACHDYERFDASAINFTCNRKSLRQSVSICSDGNDHTIWQRHIYSCFDKHFVLRVHRRLESDPSVYISLVVLHSKHHSNRYIIQIQGNHRKYTFEGPVWSIRKGFKEVERVRDCMIIPENIALFLSGGKGSENDFGLINLEITGEILP